jgi:hypothetical protein
MKKNYVKQREMKITPAKEISFICFNKDCKLRKQKSCKGFEGCPGFKGK